MPQRYMIPIEFTISTLPIRDRLGFDLIEKRLTVVPDKSTRSRYREILRNTPPSPAYSPSRRTLLEGDRSRPPLARPIEAAWWSRTQRSQPASRSPLRLSAWKTSTHTVLLMLHAAPPPPRRRVCCRSPASFCVESERLTRRRPSGADAVGACAAAQRSKVTTILPEFHAREPRSWEATRAIFTFSPLTGLCLRQRLVELWSGFRSHGVYVDDHIVLARPARSTARPSLQT